MLCMALAAAAAVMYVTNAKPRETVVLLSRITCQAAAYLSSILCLAEPSLSDRPVTTWCLLCTTPGAALEKANQFCERQSSIDKIVPI